jgi:replication factor A1
MWTSWLMIVLTVHLSWAYDVLFSFAVDLLKPNATVILRNAKIDMFKGSMRLAVDKWGRIEAVEPASFTVKEDNNLSLIEYELVNVAE